MLKADSTAKLCYSVYAVDVCEFWCLKCIVKKSYGHLKTCSFTTNCPTD